MCLEVTTNCHYFPGMYVGEHSGTSNHSFVPVAFVDAVTVEKKCKNNDIVCDSVEEGTTVQSGMTQNDFQGNLS